MARVRRIARCAGIMLVCSGLWSMVATAQSTSERSGSILIFPKIVSDGSRDTFIQISNTTNSVVHAHCFYVNAAPVCLSGIGDCLAGTCLGTCEPQWQEIDFNIWLTKQQPTHWVAGDGRFTNPLDPPCDLHTGNYDCDGAGIDPGRVPPVVLPFTGELRCIQVDASGAPISGNHLKGEATIVTHDGDVSRYNAVALLGEPLSNNGDMTLCLGGDFTEDCPSGREYAGCGDEVILSHFAEGADSPLFGPTSTVRTELTLVPCRADYELQDPTKVTVQFVTFNELEQRLSAATTVDCWGNFLLSDISNIFDVRVTQTRLMHTSMATSSGSSSGIVGVVEEFHTLDGARARAAFNLHEEGVRDETDLIVIPRGP